MSDQNPPPEPEPVPPVEPEPVPPVEPEPAPVAGPAPAPLVDLVEAQPAAVPPAAPAVPPAAPAAAPAAYAPEGPKTNVLGIVSLVTSILGLSIVGVITGHIALSQIKKRGEGGHGLALAGTIIGWVGCALWILFWAVWIFWIVVYGAAFWDMSN